MLDDRLADAGDPQAPELYRLDISRLRPAELYRLVGAIAFPLAFLVFKVFRRKLPVREGITRPEEVLPVTAEEIPGSLRELLDPPVAACEAEGFRRLLLWTILFTLLLIVLQTC